MSTSHSTDHRRMTRVEGHPGIYRKGSRYVVVWKHNGCQHKSSHRTLSEARRAKATRATGDTRPDPRERFDAYARAWLDSTQGRTRRGLSPSTRASYRDAIERMAIPHFGSARLGDITAPDIRDYIRALAGQGLSAATVRRYIAPVRALFATAVEDGLLMVNPTAGVRVVVHNERRHRPKTLTPDQISALVSEIPEHWREFVWFLAHTGTRISEALAATWGNLDQEDGAPVLRIPDSKTDAGVRSVPLSPGLSRSLTVRRAAATYATDGDPIFPNAVGTPMNRHNFNHKVWQPAAKRAGVDATPHTLRHSLASLLFERGHTAAQVAAWIGHKDPSFTLRTYVHARDLGDASFLDDALGG
jgi:integrase